MDRYRGRVGARQLRLSLAAADYLRRRDWPGNVRELDHLLARAALRAAARTDREHTAHIELADLDVEPTSTSAPLMTDALQTRTVRGDLSFREAVDEFKRGIVERALEATDGNWAAAARTLGMHRSNLHHTARRLNVRQ